MYIIAVIGARSGSKGLENKNIKLLNGKHLLAYSIDSAKAVKAINRVIVSTDLKKYQIIAESYGAEAPFLRPKYISNNTSTDYEFFIHLLNWLRDSNEELPNLLIFLRPTTPIREAGVIEDAIKIMIDNIGYTALRSVHEMSETVYKAFDIELGLLRTLEGDYNINSACKPRQSYPKTYMGNGYCDILRTNQILNNNGDIWGNQVKAFITEKIPDIHNLSDFEYVEYLMEKNEKRT